MMIKRIASFLLQNKSSGQTIAKNTFWLSASNILGRIIKAGLMIYAARLLGTNGYGVFSYALSLAVLFSIFSDVGIGALLTRRISSTGKVEARYVATSLVVKLVLILLSALVIIFVAPLFTKIPGVLVLLPIIAVLIALDGIRDFVLAINRGKQRMEIEAVIQVLTNAAIVGAGILALIFFGTSKSLMVAYVIGSGVGLAISLVMLGKYLSGIWKSFDKKLVKKIISEAWPFALLGLLGVIMINTDIIMLGFLKGASEVGLYSAAQKPIQVMYVIPAILASAFFPAITKLVNKNDKKLRKILEQVIAIALLLGFPIALGGMILGRKLMNLMFGSEYLDATLSFQILLITIIIVFPTMLIANTVFAYNKQKNFIGLIFLGAIGNVLLNILLIPKYGITGSAIATIGAEFTASTFIWIKMKKINYFVVLPYLKKIIPAALVMTVFTIVMQQIGIHLALIIILSALIYFGLLKILNEPLLKTFRSIITSI